MGHLADEFIRRRRSIVTGRGKRYTEELRQLAVGFATEAGAAGWSGSRIAEALAEGVLHVDETGWRMMGSKTNPKWALFGLTSPRVAAYHLWDRRPRQPHVKS